MKKNQPSPSKVQNPEQDPAPSLSPSLNPEAAHTAPPQQSPSPSGSSELNAPPTSEEEHIYDSPSSSPRSLRSTNSELNARQVLGEQSVYDSPPSPPRSIHSDKDDSIYSSPPSPGDSSLNESVYDQPLSPPRRAHRQDSEQSAEDFIYETSPSNRPLSSKRELHQAIYDTPSASAQLHARREHVYDVPSSSFIPRSLEGELSATAEPTQTTTKATVPPALPPRLKRSSVYEQEEKAQYTPLSPKKDPSSLYAALRKKSPVRSGNVEQNVASSQKRQSTEKTSPELPPRPALLDIYETPDEDSEYATYATIPDLVQSSGRLQNITQTPVENSMYEAISAYETIPDLPQPSNGPQNVIPPLEPEPIYETIPDLPQPSDGLQNVIPPLEPEPIYETIPDLSQSGESMQYTPPLSKENPIHAAIESELPSDPGSVEQSATRSSQSKSLYSAIGLKAPLRMKNKVPSDVSESSRMPERYYGNTLPQRAPRSKSAEKSTELPLTLGNMRQGTKEAPQQQSIGGAFRPDLPPRSGSAQQSASVSSTPSPKIPLERFSYSKDEIPSDGLERGVVFAFPRTSSDLPQSKDLLLTRELQAKSACEIYEVNVERCCSIVYGNPHLFNSKIEKITRNPDLAKKFAWQLSSEPGRFHKLAGINLCGFKNERRKEAEAGVLRLFMAVEAYGKAVKSLNKIQQALSKMEGKPLWDHDVSGKVRRMPTVQEARQEIRLLCKQVFGDTNRLDFRMEELEKAPNMAEQLAWQLETHTRRFGKLAGHEFCGLKTSARKTAEQLLPNLCEAIRDYASCVEQARESILQHHQRKVHSHNDFVKELQHLKGIQKENADLSKKAPRVVSQSLHCKSEPQKVARTFSI